MIKTYYVVLHVNYFELLILSVYLLVYVLQIVRKFRGI